MLSRYAKWRYAECRVTFISMLSVVMQSVIMLNVIMLSVIMLSVVLLNVIAPQKEGSKLYAVFSYSFNLKQGKLLYPALSYKPKNLYRMGR